jgi:hypothetical protein
MFWMDHRAHPDIETLDHHLAGRLPERASKDVREHIVACEDCQRIVTARAQARVLAFLKIAGSGMGTGK